MAARKPATAAEILQAMQERWPDKSGQAIKYWAAIGGLTFQLRTIKTKVRDWLKEASQDETHPIELIGTAGGKIVHVWRGEKTLTLREAGYTDDENVETWPGLGTNGEYQAGRSDSDADEFLISSEDLRMLVTRGVEHHRLMQEAKGKQRELIRERHGSALAYLRGLLKLADADVNQIETGAHYNLNRDKVTLSLMLADGQIERLADVLQAHDIEPDPPAQVVTKLPSATEG